MLLKSSHHKLKIISITSFEVAFQRSAVIFNLIFHLYLYFQAHSLQLCDERSSIAHMTHFKREGCYDRFSKTLNWQPVLWIYLNEAYLLVGRVTCYCSILRLCCKLITCEACVLGWKNELLCSILTLL